MQRTVRLPINDIGVPDSPRAGGIDDEYVRELAGLTDGVPPVIVHGETMRLLDGAHRLQAARVRGDATILAMLFIGSVEEGFRLAVRANLRHGRPLTAGERRAAARRILRSCPTLSDRAIAAEVGLSTRTIAGIRSDTDGGSSALRVGRDGRARPLSTVEGRRTAGQLLSERPERSLREVARVAGISVGTAHDVRDRLRSGRDPVEPAVRAVPPEGPLRADVPALLRDLRSDPSMRYTEVGRRLLRWLNLRTVSGPEHREFLGGVRPHNAATLAAIARQCAAAWSEMADELDRSHR